MDKQVFIKEVGLKRRDQTIQNTLVQTCIDQPALIVVLIEQMLLAKENSSYFARVLELVAKTNPDTLLPYFSEFTEALPLVKEDATARSSAKICEILTVQYALKKNQQYRKLLLPAHHERMITACFDWKINNRAIAIQAHAMYTLYLLGFTYAWIHPDLVLLIERNIPTGSSGYQNRGRKILKAIATQKLYKL